MVQRKRFLLMVRSLKGSGRGALLVWPLFFLVQYECALPVYAWPDGWIFVSTNASFPSYCAWCARVRAQCKCNNECLRNKYIYKNDVGLVRARGPRERAGSNPVVGCAIIVSVF